MGLLASSATLAAVFPGGTKSPTAPLAFLPTKGFLAPLQNHSVGGCGMVALHSPIVPVLQGLDEGSDDLKSGRRSSYFVFQIHVADIAPWSQDWILWIPDHLRPLDPSVVMGCG